MAPHSTSTKDATKRLIVIRHAHRNKPDGGAADNGLSKKGKRQALWAAEHFRKVRVVGPTWVASSPKVRCVETVEEIAGIAKCRLKILKELDEQGPQESNKHFLERIKKFAAGWKESGPAYGVICSHGDWIPAFLEVIAHARVDLKKGGWLELEWEPGEETARLLWILQTLEA